MEFTGNLGEMRKAEGSSDERRDRCHDYEKQFSQMESDGRELRTESGAEPSWVRRTSDRAHCRDRPDPGWRRWGLERLFHHSATLSERKSEISKKVNKIDFGAWLRSAR